MPIRCFSVLLVRQVLKNQSLQAVSKPFPVILEKGRRLVLQKEYQDGSIGRWKWVDEWYDTSSTGGEFVRTDAQFRNWITSDGDPGSSGEGGFPAEAGRYHLYVMISLSVVNPYMGEHGWTFDEAPGVIPDPVFGARYLYEIYLRAAPEYSGRVTVLILWDLERDTIVSNESAEIIRMMNTAFNEIGAAEGDYAPPGLLPQVDEINVRIYDKVNNGVYKAGFATRQRVYEQAVKELFDCLNNLEQCLSVRRYLLGDRITEADWRLFTTLIRFDSVYHGHFKCNLRRLIDYPHLWSYTRELYQWPGIAPTVNMGHIKEHYYRSHPAINPNGIVPAGPILDLDEPPRPRT